MKLSSKQRAFVLYAVLGAAAFWFPNVALNWWAFRHRSDKSIGVSVVLSMVMLLLTFFLARKLGSLEMSRKRIVLSMLMGIWVSAPSFLMLGASVSGAKEVKVVDLLRLLVTTVLFPIYTLIGSIADASFPALVVASAVMGIAYRLESRKA